MQWRSLTTPQVTTLEQGRQTVRWYRMRWIVEQLFRRIEDSQMEDANCFTKLAIVGLITATRSM